MLQRTGPILGGVVLGMGLTILPFALDRADLPTPVPASLSWHQPERLSSLELESARAHAYLELEVRLVEHALAGDIGEGERERVLDYLSATVTDPTLRAWADQAPRLRSPQIEVEPIAWGDELQDVDAVSEPVVVEPPPEPVPANGRQGFGFLEVLRDADRTAMTALDIEPADLDTDTEVVVAQAPEPVAQHSSAPVVASEPVQDAVAQIEVPTGPVRAVAADSKVFVDLEVGDDSLIPASVSGRVGQLVQCFESSLEFDPELAGHIEVEWHIRHGRVNALEVGDDSLGDEIALRCMTERIRRWRFESDVTGMVAWHFAFETQPG